MSKYRLSKLMMLLVIVALVSTLTCAQPIDLDANNGRHWDKITLRPGDVYMIQVSIKQYDKVQITIAPTNDPISIIIRDPVNKLVDRRTIDRKSSINLEVDNKGIWTFIIEYPQYSATRDRQEIYIEITGITGYLPPSSLPPTFPFEFMIPLVSIIVGIAAALVILTVVIKRKPAPTPPPTPPPTYAAPPAGGEGTVMMEKPTSRAETEIFLAALELPDGRVLPIASPRQIFGRTDFERLLSPDMLKFISRRHFMIHLESGGFFIEDLGSANGTSVNGVDIRGKGKIPLKSGDLIEVGGVVKLKFKAGP